MGREGGENSVSRDENCYFSLSLSLSLSVSVSLCLSVSLSLCLSLSLSLCLCLSLATWQGGSRLLHQCSAVRVMQRLSLDGTQEPPLCAFFPNKVSLL